MFASLKAQTCQTYPAHHSPSSSSRHLRRLGTNLVTGPVMIKLVERMPVSASYKFHFFKLGSPGNDRLFKVERISATQLSVFYMSIFPDGYKEVWEPNAFQCNVEFQNAAAYFNSLADGFFSHWLDGLEPPNSPASP